MDHRADSDRRRRAGSMVLQLVLLALVWWLLNLHWVITGALAAIIVLGAVVPARWSGPASGLGALGLAVVAYSYYGDWRVAAVFGAFAVYLLAASVLSPRRG